MSPVPLPVPRPGAAHAAALGLGAYRPSRLVPNDDLVAAIDSSDEWIQQRSGIRTRRWAAEHETVQSMSVAASREAIEQAGIAPEQIDAVIVATVTHMLQTPALAPAVAHELGLSRPAAFDVSAACAGFCHAVALASDMIRGGSARYALVIGVEKLSDITDPRDRGSAFIFGDGAGAVVVSASDEAGIGPTVWGSDGGQWDVITQNQPWDQLREDKDLEWPTLRMAGQSVFRWAVWQMAPVARKAIEAAGITPDDLDAFIPHQANVRIIDAMVKQLALPAHVPVARDIAETGNTSAASIPLAMHRMLADGDAPSGGLALLIGFGAGLAYAAQVVRLP